ncbi:MAG: type II toxin-antitoxin system VapC family toxin [Labedaea sp.]
MTRLLLDTHVVIWWLAADPRLGAKARDAIADRDGEVFVSAVTSFELATKKTLGKLDAPDDLAEQLEANAFEELPVTIAHGWEAGRLPLHHKDPFDRLLIAQARCEGLTLVTADQMLRSYDVVTMPA